MMLKDMVAVVTGGSRGIGKATALALAGAGAIVVVVARTVEKDSRIAGTIMKTVEEIKARGGRALPMQTNIKNDAEVENMVEQTLRKLGHIEILVNNAATNIPRYFKDVTLKQWDLITDVTLRGTIVCTKAVLPSMMGQKYGHIINISAYASADINTPMTGLAYDVSKAGVNRFTWGLAEELREYNIAVNALKPGNTVTEGWAMLNPDVDKSEWQRAEMWANMVTFIATRDPATFTGKVLGTEDAKREASAAGWKL